MYDGGQRLAAVRALHELLVEPSLLALERGKLGM